MPDDLGAVLASLALPVAVASRRMSRRDNAEARCRRCRMHEVLCLCALIPRIETRTRLVLVIHRYEERKPTNSGQLAALCLPNSEVLRARRGRRAGAAVHARSGDAAAPALSACERAAARRRSPDRRGRSR